jgi:ankyrin repeat protein
VSCDNPFDNPLVKAAEKGLTEAIKCLLEAGANPNVHDTVRMLLLSHSCTCLAWL